MRTFWVTLLGAAICACTGSVGDDDNNTGPDYTGPGPNGDPSDMGPGGDDGGGTFTPRYFQQPMFFDQDVSALTKSSASDAQMAALTAAGGWGTGKMQIDFSIDVLTGDASTPMRSFEPNGDFYEPDCDHVDMPVPVGGNVEGEDGYACTNDGDCHLIVNMPGKLYEMWRADITSTFSGGCLAVWNTAATYTDALRGDQCTSADAAGFPIAPLLFSADEVAAGHIDHAIRYILPNDRVKRGFVRPATHGSDTTGGSSAQPYGTHLRLRADYPVDSLPSEGAKVVARAMQKYGMYQADGGKIALTAQTDQHTTAKWADLLGPLDLQGLHVTDFEVIDHGSMIPLTYDCNR